ncbi:MFS transporter [Enterobacter cloacae complex sp. RIVM_C039474]|uniref:MFS transporter n=1 Tax=Enterobacteriaceae TaxID=543 RepID=UPI00038FF343|nr:MULTISPECIES: MFS transporter [Enterobacteriaceae]EEH95957.2 drug:H+ antiporter-2 (14 Spanner) (DHA2) family drug resistance MFS transporter [Citrobacter portucalensis]MDC4194480.1 MFS transporter [Enterobacter cloacae complex sp. RIVM_C039474]
MSHTTSTGLKYSPGQTVQLLVIATAQLMLVLDDSIANIALPSIQSELGIQSVDLFWVINAYIIAFGGLLLFGGRLGDILGRRRILQWGMGIFTLASMLAGLATSGEWLISARALQGIGAAMTAPNVLALISTTFPGDKERHKAMSVYGAMSGLGLVAGLLAGGILTDLLGWRWVFFVNVPVGIVVLVGTRILSEAGLHEGKLNAGSALSSVFGMTLLIFFITRAGEMGWTDRVALSALVMSVVLLSLFVFIQFRSANPLLPLRLLHDRSRAGSYGAALLLGFGPMGTLFLMTLFMQDVLLYSPLQTGLAWLPFGLAIIVGAAVTTRMLAWFSPRLLAALGGMIASTFMLWLSMIEQTTRYSTHIMPAMFGVAFGFVMAILSVTLTAVHRVPARDSGIASALFNASQQTGVALGLAILSTLSFSVTNRQLPDAMAVLRQGHSSGNGGLVDTASMALINGYSVALMAGAGAMLLAALSASILIRSTSSGNTR